MLPTTTRASRLSDTGGARVPQLLWKIAMDFDERIRRPGKHITIELAPINSCAGISYDTLQAIAESYRTSVEEVILHALSQLAEKEIPDFDPDSPFLTSAQEVFLCLRGEKMQREKEDQANSRGLLSTMLRSQGE